MKYSWAKAQDHAAAMGLKWNDDFAAMAQEAMNECGMSQAQATHMAKLYNRLYDHQTRCHSFRYWLGMVCFAVFVLPFRRPR